MTYQNITDGGIGHSTIVSDAFLFFHGNTVSEEVQASDQWERVVELQRAFIDSKGGGLRAIDEEWLYEVVTAYTNNTILPNIELTWSKVD